MSEMKAVTEHINAVSQEMLSLIEEVFKKATEYALPEVPVILRNYHEKLQANKHNVLVVGEAKRGKSTFINALIGESILPVDVDIATSEVFRVQAAEKEAYRLRFEDGSAKDIHREDLEHYGKQGIIDTEGLPTLNQIIRWIEVDVTNPLLPPNINLLDTPGMGSLYTAHAQITQRFLPEADAVIFVLKPRPIIEPEIQFLTKILNVTKHVFFVETWIEKFSDEELQDIEQRNIEILKSHLGSLLPDDIRIWRISSTSFLKYIESDKKKTFYLKNSQYDQMLSALQVFLFGASGWQLSYEAEQRVKLYYDIGHLTLSDRLRRVSEHSVEKNSALQPLLAQQKQQFDEEWGRSGHKTADLQEAIRKISRENRKVIEDALQANGDIAIAIRAKIDALASSTEAKEYSKIIAEEVTSRLTDIWRHIDEQIHTQCSEQLGSFLEAVNSVGLLLETNMVNFSIKANADLKIREDWLTLFVGIGSVLTSVWAPTSTALTSLVFVPHVAIVAAAIGLIWATAKTLLSREETQAKSAKEQLSHYLDNVLLNLREQFLGKSQDLHARSRVDSYFDTLETSLFEQVQRISKKKSQEAQADLDRLTLEASLDDQQRQTVIKETQQQLAEWEQIDRALQNVLMHLNELHLFLKTPAKDA